MSALSNKESYDHQPFNLPARACSLCPAKRSACKDACHSKYFSAKHVSRPVVASFLASPPSHNEVGRMIIFHDEVQTKKKSYR